MRIVPSLRRVLGATRDSISTALRNLSARRFTPETLEALEAILLEADLGLETTESILALLRRSGRGDFIPTVKTHLLSLLPSTPEVMDSAGPAVIMVVGINGSGKTTSAAKLARFYQQRGNSILLVGADTYRAAAVNQLRVWSERLQIRLVCNERSQDPSAVLFDGLTAATADRTQITVVDTAGRLHTYRNLMEELAKMARVVANRFPNFRLITLLTIDAGLGQNSLVQAREFSRHMPVDGVILTKMDGSARGGIVFPLQQKLQIPVVFLGVGEHLDDLVTFDPREYVEALIAPEP